MSFPSVARKPRETRLHPQVPKVVAPKVPRVEDHFRTGWNNRSIKQVRTMPTKIGITSRGHQLSPKVPTMLDSLPRDMQERNGWFFTPQDHLPRLSLERSQLTAPERCTMSMSPPKHLFLEIREKKKIVNPTGGRSYIRLLIGTP